MDVYVARQPILDRNLNTYGYELLFRGGLDNIFPDIDGDTASSAVLSNSFLSIGMPQLTGGKKAFINFTRDLLLKEIPCLFSTDSLYIELLETIEPNEEVISAVEKMNKKGYRFALDDFKYQKDILPLVDLAKIIKIDIRETPLEEAGQMISNLANGNIKFLAEKVETQEEYHKALKMGFSYFQGYFFSKPEIIQHRSIAPSQIKLLQIIGELNREEAEVSKLEDLIKSDVSLSYKLLKYMNSSFYKVPNQVKSIKGAIMFLGLKEVRKIVTLLATAKLAGSKPDELIRTSVLRAKLCELIGETHGYKGDISELFLLGLFSLMDAILDSRMEDIIDQLPVSEPLKLALIKNEGELAGYLELTRCFEKGMWDDCPPLDISKKISGINFGKYTEAVHWADTFLG